MDESEDNLTADDSKSGEILSSIKSKPKKRSLVERELETNLTARVTSPVTNGEASNTSRYGRARRAKTEFDISDSEKNTVKSLKSPVPELTPSSAQLPPVYKMYASNSPVKSETANKPERRSRSIETSLDNQIEIIYNENILLSRFSSSEKKNQSPNAKFPKVYVRTDLIQKKEKEESVTLIKSIFSPASGKKSGQSTKNSHIKNILERSSEKYNLNTSTTKTKSHNRLTNMSSVVKTLDFDNHKKKKENQNKAVLTKSEIFELEAKCEYQVGDLAWARMGTYPFWPCIITREPTTNMFVKNKVFGRVEHHVIHVTFFGDNGRRSWIMDSMLRKFLGQLEFETTREHFSPKAKKRDPRLYAAFFVSEKKMSQWSISVEEAETLLREPKRLRIDLFNDMLVKSRSVKIEKQNKSGKVVRTSSNVSLSESLFDTLFSENEGKTEDLDGSRSKTKNSLDVSEVVTACLDNMAAKTGNSMIQRQSHMDRWLQKAKSKTPEKLQVKLQIPSKEKEKVISSKKKRYQPPKNVPIKKPYSFRNSLESQTLKSHHNEHDYSNRDTTIDEIDTTVNCVMSGRGIGRIAKVESLADIENKKYDILVEITDSDDIVTCKSPTYTQDYNEIDDASLNQNVKSNEDSEIPKSSEKNGDVTCESPTFTQDYNEIDDSMFIQDINIVKSNEDSEIPKSNEINGIELGKHENVVFKNKQAKTEFEFEHLNFVNKVAEMTSDNDDKATENCIEVEFGKTLHKTPNTVCYSAMNGHLEKTIDIPFQSVTDMDKKSRLNENNFGENENVLISSKNHSHIDINKSSDSVTIQDTDTSFDNSSQEEIDNSFSRFIKPRSQNKSSRQKRSLRLRTPKKPHAAKNRDDGFAKYAELRQDALIDEHPELTHTEIMAYLLKTWQYENRDETDNNDNKNKDIILDRIEKNTESENILLSTKISESCTMGIDKDISQDCNHYKDEPVENTLKSTISLEVKSKDKNIIPVRNQSLDKPIENTLKSSISSDVTSKDIDVIQDRNLFKDKPIDITLKSIQSSNIKSKDKDISQGCNQSKDKLIENTLKSTKSSDVMSMDIDVIQDRILSKDKLTDNTFKSLKASDIKSNDIDYSQECNQSKDKLIENTLKSVKTSDVKSKDTDFSQDHKITKEKVSNALHNTKQIAIDNIKAQSKKKICTVNLTDFLLDSSINITFNNADESFVKAVYEKANKSKKIDKKKMNYKNLTVKVNDVLALKTESSTSKINSTDTSCDELGSDVLKNSSSSVLRKETQNGFRHSNRKRYSTTAIHINDEKSRDIKNTEFDNTSVSKEDHNCVNMLTHDKVMDKIDNYEDNTVVDDSKNEISEIYSMPSSETKNDLALVKHSSGKTSIQDEILCDVLVANKENVNIENKHTKNSSVSSCESIVDFPGNVFPDPSDIITANDDTRDDSGQEIDCILKSIDDIVNDKNPNEPNVPKLDRNESLEAIQPDEKDLNCFNKCDDKEIRQNKEVELTILAKNDNETSKSEGSFSKSKLNPKEQSELSRNNETGTDQKIIKHNINVDADVVEPSQNLPESIRVNGFHYSDDCSPDFSDGEYNAETSSVNSEDSEPLSKVRNKLRLKNRHKKNKDIDYPEFIKYMELRQDALMDDHPELSQEELVDYMHKAWLYEQNSKSDYMKTDDIERSGLVKGLNDDLRQKSIRNSFRESEKRRNKQKDEDSLSINSDITSKESSPERKVLGKSDQTIATNSDISGRSLRRKRRIKTLGETKTDAISLDTPSKPDGQIVSNNTKDTQDEPQLVTTKKTQPSSDNDCNSQKYFGIFNHVEAKPKHNSENKPEDEVNIKEEFDPETVSIKSDEIEVSLSKRKQRRHEKQANKDDPEFLKYLELRQDALIDENPQLSQDEIISYLFKTWLYEEGAKSDIKKSDDIEQARLVKGLNAEEAQPKRIKRKIKTEKEPPTDDDVVPKAKPKRKTSQPYYIEDELSDTEDVEMFDIFKSKQQLQSSDVIDVDTGDEIDEVELYFSELTNPKPNIFRGLVREKVCEICERTSNLVKCKGCSCMFHVDCVTKQLEVKVEVPPTPTRGRKKKKKAGRKPKNLDESESQSDEKSQDFSEENNISVEDLEPESRTVDAEDFESVLEVKMKELIPAIEIYDSCSSDDGLDWSDSVAGKCQIVDVLLKPKSEPVDYSDFKCNDCKKFDLPKCFVCKLVISKTGVEYRQRCQAAHCNTYYHMECLDHWPQTQFNAGELSKISNNAEERFEDFMCPKHVCHTCVSDDPRGCKTRFSGDKLARCVRCPATYHSFTKCLPAGSLILTGSHIVCPRHHEHRPGKVPCHVNTGWCFICALGGSLICCEYCPTSFHAECLNIKPPEGGYMCEDCETGRLPLYGEMVWVKLGHYRWWPGIVLHPCEIPDNIMAVKHSPGEFVVRFFGQYDHYWVNRGRVFPFQEGDSGRISSQKSKIDAAFTTAMEHAQRACEILKSAENNEEEDTDIASSLLPPHYVKLKVNKPVGSLCGRRIDIEESSLTQCDCNPDEEDPCGPYSQCLNRMLLTECGPSCRAGERCNNRAFEKRRYPRVAPYRTPHRGWGLRALQDIKAGTFVIEYVGELLDEEEFRRRMNRKHEIRDENFYFLTLDKERMIDAGPKGNLARFMNHCCEPNCETQKWTVLGDVRVGLFAIKDIPANSELTFNYNLECTGIEKKRCMCGAKRCSGYIGAKPKQDEPQQKKKALVAKRPYKKRNKPTEDSPSTSKNKPKRPVGRPAKPKELTEIEKDLLIIKNATNGLSSDSECSGRLSSLDSDKNINALKRKRVDFSTDEVGSSEANSPSSKKTKLDEEKTREVGD